MKEPQSRTPASAASSLRPKGRRISTKQQVETRTVNGVTTVTKTETVLDNGVETVNVYENNKLGKHKSILLIQFPYFFFCSKKNKKWYSSSDLNKSFCIHFKKKTSLF